MTIKNTLFVGKVFEWLESVDSTNRFTRDLLSKSKPPEGTVVATARQTAGRGQIGSNWESEPDKNVTCSVIFYPVFLEARRQFLLNQSVALAIHDVLSALKMEGVKIKWPNDIYAGHKKICGLLLQNSIAGNFLQTNISGIGLNVNQFAFLSDAPNPTSVFLETGKTAPLAEMYQLLCEKLEFRYLQLRRGEAQKIDRDYHENLYLLETEHDFFLPDETVLKGKIKGVNETGKLLVQCGAKLKIFDFKEIAFGKKT